MSKIADKIIDEISAAIENDELQLPTLPEVALEVREAAGNENIDVPKLAEIVARDAALTARMIKVANSSLYRANSEIQDLQTAIGRFGIVTASNLATAAAMQQMFLTTSKIIEDRMQAVWTKSVEVASICHALARHFSKLKPEQAALGGLVHRIGALPILSYAERNDDLANSHALLDEVVEAAHREIGARILDKWEFPDALKEVPSQYTNFERTLDEADYVDIVMVANVQSHMGTDHPLADLDWSSVSAFARLGLAAAPESLEAEAFVDEVQEAARMLN